MRDVISYSCWISPLEVHVVEGNNLEQIIGRSSVHKHSSPVKGHNLIGNSFFDIYSTMKPLG